MSQARVTDFYSRTKKATGGPTKPAEPRSAFSCSSTVHEEFLRVIDEAAGLNHGAEQPLSSPRTPKRGSADLGATVSAAAVEHSTAKKRRQADLGAPAAAAGAERPARRSARKKLEVPADTAQVLGKEDIAALKSRLLRIKKHVDEIPATASSATPSPSLVPDSSSSAVPETIISASAEAKTLKLSVARAKELAAKAQKRKEAKAAAEHELTETRARDSTEQPAYQRYHTLAQDAPPGLSLPYHYKVLAEMFRSMDTVVAMLYNRCETATFTKIKRGVQDMMHKRFEESHVGQIKTVFPEAYTFRQEKHIQAFNSSIKKGSYQLTVDPIIVSENGEARPVLSASRLLERRRVFHNSLLSIVKQHHKVFLSSLDPPVLVPEDKLTRWHPRFNVDSVPAVHTSALPQTPRPEKLATAQEMEKALIGLALKTEDKAAHKEPTSQENPTVPQTSAVPAVPNALKGVSQSLLDRIRAKEAQKLQAVMTRNSKQEERLLMMSRLGELARILRSVFVAEKKPALTMEVACNRMVASYRSALSTGEMEKHIHLLAEVAGDWLTLHTVRKDLYLKLNKNMELSTVTDTVNSRLREEETELRPGGL
ncbi:DNA replication factor Cdt1 isoform X2 [Haplochromis burtoni]|uniref:DNA replication factor Cdt1 isoform X2 n=1 Tax=Haplochromis burtoni TaxID=8153 RepID=UPI0003BD995C|nr:DNA replication factor Cdt1 isoform X2 [Haplochromis burtoni]